MATVNKRFLKKVALHSNFSKRLKDSRIKEMIDVTGVEEFLKKDWEQLVELNPEYLQPEKFYDQLLRENLTPREWKAISKKNNS